MRLLLALIANLWLLVRFPWLALRRARAAPKGAWLTVQIDGAVVEIGQALPWWDRRPRPLSIYALRDVVRLAKDDPRVAGFVITLRGLRAGGAISTSLRESLLEARAAGKRVVVHLPDGAGTRQLYVASAADTLYAGPETEIAALGFAAEVQYLRQPLDRLGIEPEVFARGKYKTAAESLVSTTMSEGQREQLEALLDTSYDVLVRAIAEGRRVDETTARRWIDEGPWPAREAKAQGIVDEVLYDDELPHKLEPSRKDGAVMFPAGAYRLRRRIRWAPFRKPQVIAVVQVHGAIVSRDEEHMLPVADASAICEALDAVRKDSRVRGLVVHVDSRGGSAVASDRILHALRRVREKKPVVACMGDVAASGGYMAAVAGETIVAQPNTITGSIGVIAARVVVERLLEKLGVQTALVKRGARADMMSPSRHAREDERLAIERHVELSYRSFLESVAAGRSRTIEEIEPLAGGRVWSGRDAKDKGLVDVIGGFEVALGLLRERIGTGAGAMEPVVIGGRPLRSLLSLLPIPMRAAMARWVSSGVPEIALLAGSGTDRTWAWCDVVEKETR